MILRRRCTEIALAILLTACTGDSAKRHYMLAEQLWTDGKYAASVSEFEKTTAKDPGGILGIQALYRAGTTQMLFLSQYGEAVRKFNALIQSSHDPKLVWEAQKQVGEIYFNKTEQYDLAANHYRELLRLNPRVAEVPEFTYRIARSDFFVGRFDQAVETYRKLIQDFPRDPWAERALYEIAVTQLTRGQDYHAAERAYRRFLAVYPQSSLVPEARFGIAASLEELDQLEAAAQIYESLRGSYPSRNVIEIKLARIRERRSQKSPPKKAGRTHG